MAKKRKAAGSPFAEEEPEQPGRSRRPSLVSKKPEAKTSAVVASRAGVDEWV